MDDDEGLSSSSSSSTKVEFPFAALAPVPSVSSRVNVESILLLLKEEEESAAAADEAGAALLAAMKFETVVGVGGVETTEGSEVKDERDGGGMSVEVDTEGAWNLKKQDHINKLCNCYKIIREIRYETRLSIVNFS